MTCAERRSSLAPNSFKGTTGNFDVNLSQSDLLYGRKMPFWKTKCFLFSTVLISCAVFGVLTFFAVNEIYNPDLPSNHAYNLENASRYKFKNSVIPSENQIKSSSSFPVIQQQIRSYRLDRDEVREQEISVTCELKNGIKELNNEVKRLYDSLARLDERMNREKRGLDERTAIADCVQMKDKFRKIYEDLNRISETLSLIDEHGICRCKCPLDRIPGIPDAGGTATTRTTAGDPTALELTTFATLDRAAERGPDRTSAAGGKTKQLKKIIVTDYDPQIAADCSNDANDKFRCDTDPLDVVAETTTTTTTTDDDLPIEVTGNPVTTAKTSVVNPTDPSPTTYEPQTVYSEIVTEIYENPGKPDTSTVAAPIENIETTPDTNSDDDDDDDDGDEVFSGSTKETLVDNETTSSSYGVLGSTTKKLSDSGGNDGHVATDQYADTTTTMTLNENVYDPTTRILDSEENFSDDNYNHVTENSFVRTTTTTTADDENSFPSTTRSSDDVLDVTSPGYKIPIVESTGKNDETVDETGRNSAEDRDKSYYRNGTEDVTTIANENRNPSDTGNRQPVQSSKWYPVCFYPVPCSPDVADHLPDDDAQHVAGKNTIQYSSQSLNAYKKKASFADPTVIQNNYPIISYCPKGMVCQTTDFAGQPNVLHCMMKSTTTHGDGTMPTNTNRTDENVPKQPIRTVYDKTMTRAKSARDSDEIITGNLDCPLNTFPCVDNSGCVDTENWCDGRIHCEDASDESQCKCKERIDKDKLCDGYYDCPNGEDELGCFGCNNETFSCGDWNIISQRSSCFQRKNRCDFTKHCPNGRDEEECTLLSKHIENPNQIFFVSYSTGYLHHNWRGDWYPMCGGDNIETWAEKACAIESGEKSKPSKIQYVNGPTGHYGRRYVGLNEENHITLLGSCAHQGILVECETETCGVRSELKFIKNVDPDRMRRSSYFDFSNNNASRISRSKDPRVVGGVASNPGAWPWLIALYQDGIFHCGGVILSDEWVLTAAHCVNNYQKHYYEVQAGILRRFSFSPMEQIRTVTHVIIHTQYSRSTMINDLAVLRLERSLEFNRWIRPVCLPDHKLDWIPFPGTICTAVGWGATVEHGPDPDNMREVEVPILPECTHKTDIDGREICAGYLSGGHDTCQGDSGGPLLCRDPNNLNKWYVAGIVSHGEGCARPMEPGVYTRVALFMGWIIQVTGAQRLPEERPRQYCPGIRCETGNHCIPTKRQCDKYVDCMNAEDERNCDYTGSQYRVDFYRSKNTDHSNLKYSKLKNAKENEQSENVTAATAFGNTNATLPKSNTAARSEDVVDETSTVGIRLNNNTAELKNAVLDAIRQLFDSQFTEKTFSCTRITQVVLANHRCDGSVDCEDGTDEESCDCKSRLASMYNSSAICDGVADCYDGTDEMGCGEPKCKIGETVCGLPKKCVKISAWCDGIVDCSGDGIDEKYCTALANTNAGITTVVMDTTGRPTFRQSGMVAVNSKGVWRMRCVDDRTPSKIAHETCLDLQFSNSNYFEKRISSSNPLPLNVKNLKFADMCQGLYVECGARKTVDAKLHHWHADIIVDGKLGQSGMLMDNSWVLVKRTGLNLKQSYATAVLGSGAHSSLRIKSPYEQIVRVDGISKIPDTDLDLLHLSAKTNVSRGVTPLKLPLFQPSPGENDTCYAIGYYSDHGAAAKVDAAYLRPDTKRPCAVGHLCFTVLRKPQSCSIGKNITRVTAVVCESNFGLFLAASAVQYDMDFCGRNARVQLPEAEDLMNKIAQIIDDENVNPTPPPLCNGKRCQLGECVPWEKVCDGIPNCRDEQDETIKMCRARTEKCKANNTLCICGVGNFRCANGKCVKKSAFCNGIDNCGDGTDEPKSCRTNACAEYLRLTAPERLCDGRWDCLDKTDEEFTNCPAGYCNRTNVYQCRSSNKCVSSELVCDGEMDCPESDDEEKCIGLITSAGKKNEGVLATRSYGNWHAQCVTDDYTDMDYHSLCRGLGFTNALGIRKTTGAEIVFENFAMVQLNAGTDVTIRSPTKNILQYTGRPCTTVYVACTSS